jgi:hypothetical protein
MCKAMHEATQLKLKNITIKTACEEAIPEEEEVEEEHLQNSKTLTVGIHTFSAYIMVGVIAQKHAQKPRRTSKDFRISSA